MEHVQPLSKIYIYDEPDAPGLDIAQIGAYLASQFPTVKVLPRRAFLTHQFARFTTEQREELEPEVIKQLDRARATNVTGADGALLADLIEPEEQDQCLVLEAAAFQSVLRLLVDPEESGPDHLHIVFTDNLIGSRRDADQEFRLRIICMGAPSIISTTGMVEALPRPKEYEFKRAQFAMLGIAEEAMDDLADEFAERTFGYGDARVDEIGKGYALMACFERVFGDGFCPEPDCRLHAAKTQQELIETQCGETTGLCERHQMMLRSLAPGSA